MTGPRQREYGTLVLVVIVVAAAFIIFAVGVTTGVSLD